MVRYVDSQPRCCHIMTPSKLFIPIPLLLFSVIWYQPKSGDAFFEGLLGLTESGNSLALRLWPKSTVSWLHALDQYQLILSREITDVIGKAVKRYWRLHQTCEVLCVLHDAALAVYRLRPDVPPQAAGSQSSRPADSVAQYQLQRPD